jgi:D-galacturonate reductase
VKVLVIGGGIYVKGSDVNHHGTIIPAIIESLKNKLISEVCYVTTSNKSAKNCVLKSNQIAKEHKILKKNIFFSFESNSKLSYKKALKVYNPDAVIVATPDHTHFQICKEVIRFNKHLLVVKPLSSSFREVRQLVSQIKNKKKIYQVEFHKRLDEANTTLKKILVEGKIGNLKYCVIEYSQKKIIPEFYFKKWASKSNSFQYLGVHYADLIYFLTGYKPHRVWAWAQKGYLKRKKINTWDSVQACIEWRLKEKKFTSHIITNWIDSNNSSATSDQKINFVGEKGRYSSDQKNRGIEFSSDVSSFTHINPYFTNQAHNGNNYFYDGYGIRNIMNFFIDINQTSQEQTSHKKIKELNSTFYDSAVSTKIIEAVSKSLKENSRQVVIKND